MEKEIIKTILTQEGFDKLTEELRVLKNEKRDEVAKRIKVAISFGDLSENSEYEDAKNEQAHLEGRISELEGKLANVSIIEQNKVHKTVMLGSKVTIQNLETKDEHVVTIVGSMEFDPDNLKISNESPIGKGALDKKVGDKFLVKLAGGNSNFKILSIK